MAYCEMCGNLLTRKEQKRFCSRACSDKYIRENRIYIALNDKRKKVNEAKEILKKFLAVFPFEIKSRLKETMVIKKAYIYNMVKRGYSYPVVGLSLGIDHTSMMHNYKTASKESIEISQAFNEMIAKEQEKPEETNKPKFLRQNYKTGEKFYA